MLDEEGERVDRARAGLYFARWFPERSAEWTEVLGQLWEQGLAVTDLSGEVEQLALLAVSHAAGVESDAILSALDSRFSAVREEAQRLLALLDDDGRADLRRTLLLHAARYPGAALRAIEDELAAPVAAAPTAGCVLWSALALLEDRPKRSVAEKVQRWLEPDGAFERLLAGRPCPEEVQLKVRILFRAVALERPLPVPGARRARPAGARRGGRGDPRRAAEAHRPALRGRGPAGRGRGRCRS